MISIIITVIIVGVLLYVVNAFIPMAAPIKQLLNVLVIVLLVLWLLSVFGVYHLPHVRA